MKTTKQTPPCPSPTQPEPNEVYVLNQPPPRQRLGRCVRLRRIWSPEEIQELRRRARLPATPAEWVEQMLD